MTGNADPGGPWVPVGVGVHTGLAFVGAVGSTDSAPDISALGDTVNTGAGELLFSDAARTAAGFKNDGLEARHLSLKGRRNRLMCG